LISMRSKALVAWSSGKDSAWARHEVRRAGDLEIIGDALTTVTEGFGRVSMHGVREELLRAQLDAAGLRAIVVYIPFPFAYAYLLPA
jgi:diphthamide synthase (EF-2-diphthine--ammonia ligase)